MKKGVDSLDQIFININSKGDMCVVEHFSLLNFKSKILAFRTLIWLKYAITKPNPKPGINDLESGGRASGFSTAV